MRRVCLQLFRFSTSQGIKPTEATGLTTAQQKFTQTPIHLRPYDKAKYQVPSNKIKKNSGYALLQIQPFPRARIMKICLNILQQLKIGIPEDSVDRIYLEERTKYVMEVTDKIQDIQELQKFFNTDSVELLILGLSKNLQFIDILRKNKLWELKSDGTSQALKKIKSKHSEKFPIYKKGQIPSFKLIDA